MSHEIKVNGYKPSKWPSRPEMNVDAHEKPAVQPDWEQNDEYQPDYIKSRPFYEEKVDTLFDFTVEKWRSLITPDTVACSWRIAGVDYIDVVPSSPEDGVFIYELGIVHVTVVPRQNYINIDPSDANIHLLKREFNIKQIDSKFLPPNHFVVKVTNDSNGNFTVDKTIAEIIEAYEAGKDVVASFSIPDIEYPLSMISKKQSAAIFDISVPGRDSAGFRIDDTGVAMSDIMEIPKISPVDAINQMNVPVGVDDQGKLFSENPTFDVYGSDIKLNVFKQLSVGKTVRCRMSELEKGNIMLLPHSYDFSGTGYRQHHGIAICHNSNSELPIRLYTYVSENGTDGAKLMLNPINNEIIGTNVSGNAVSFCGEPISNTTLTEAKSIYHAQRSLLTYNHEPFITAELTDSSITIVYMGKGEDGQYGVQKTTFGGITWKSETT